MGFLMLHLLCGALAGALYTAFGGSIIGVPHPRCSKGKIVMAKIAFLKSRTTKLTGQPDTGIEPVYTCAKFYILNTCRKLYASLWILGLLVLVGVVIGLAVDNSFSAPWSWSW